MTSSFNSSTGLSSSGDCRTERLRLRGVRKSFGGTHALRNVSLELRRGEVLALIGENGAGKSTLMKILSGACQPDSGEIYLENELYCPKDPLHARRHGVEMIYQELNLAPHLTVEENILLGCEPSTLGWIHKKERRETARRALAELQHPNLPLDAPVYSRSIAEQQVIEIARALIGSPRVLIMDEPTSSLTQVDTENLFAAIERLAERGVSIIYISHFLEECLRIADSYVVLRDGETVGSGRMEEADLGEIIHLMVGRELQDIYPKVEHHVADPVLRVQNLSGKRIPTEISLTLRAGEIFGLAGLVGAGRTETLRTLFGLEPGSVEKIELAVPNKSNHERNRPFSPASALARGIGLLSENRKEEGLMLNLAISDNLTLPRLGPFSKAGLLDAVEQRESARKWIAKMNVRSRDPSQPIGELSGGNQQKIAIARLLHSEADILLLDEPTRGIDVASKAQIYQLIGELASSGKAIIFVSSYLPELLGVCDTIGVMCRGKLAAVQPASAWTEHTIIAAAIGQC